MAETSGEIPDRESFKPSEVCELVGVQPYVLRSWEQEFPRLGLTKAQGSPRVYRRADVELVLRIKQLVFAEGLTLSGARRRIDAELAQETPDPSGGAQLSGETRKRLAAIKKDLRELHELLSDSPRAKRKAAPASQPDLPELNPRCPARGPRRGRRQPRRPPEGPRRDD